jgi:hypothetical protein
MSKQLGGAGGGDNVNLLLHKTRLANASETGLGNRVRPKRLIKLWRFIMPTSSLGYRTW